MIKRSKAKEEKTPTTVIHNMMSYPSKLASKIVSKYVLSLNTTENVRIDEWHEERDDDLYQWWTHEGTLIVGFKYGKNGAYLLL